jgi:hypothetical protein
MFYITCLISSPIVSTATLTIWTLHAIADITAPMMHELDSSLLTSPRSPETLEQTGEVTPRHSSRPLRNDQPQYSSERDPADSRKPSETATPWCFSASFESDDSHPLADADSRVLLAVRRSPGTPTWSSSGGESIGSSPILFEARTPVRTSMATMVQVRQLGLQAVRPMNSVTHRSLTITLFSISLEHLFYPNPV